MNITIHAVYKGGVLHPLQPLPFADGESVEVTVHLAEPCPSPLRPPTPEEEDYAKRMKAARTLEEVIATTTTAPPLPPGYDLSRALNANRKATGERLLFPEHEDGSTQ